MIHMTMRENSQHPLKSEAGQKITSLQTDREQGKNLGTVCAEHQISDTLMLRSFQWKECVTVPSAAS